MKASYFKNYPLISLKQDGVTKLMTDVSRYARISNDILAKSYEYYDYVISDDERPDQVSFLQYGDTKFYWIILLINNIRNIWTEWPLGQSGFESFIINKYGSVADAQNGVYRYLAKQDIYKAESGSLSELIIANTESVDGTTITDYSLVSDTDYETKSNYEREYELNDAKRNIKLVRAERLNDLQRELKSLFGR